MPMTKPEDYPSGDESKDYCRYCARPDGSMQSYDEKLKSMTAFLMRTQGWTKQPHAAWRSARWTRFLPGKTIALIARQPFRRFK